MASGLEPWLLIVGVLAMLLFIVVVAILVAVLMFAAQITVNAKPPHPHVRRR